VVAKQLWQNVHEVFSADELRWHLVCFLDAHPPSHPLLVMQPGRSVLDASTSAKHSCVRHHFLMAAMNGTVFITMTDNKERFVAPTVRLRE